MKRFVLIPFLFIFAIKCFAITPAEYEYRAKLLFDSIETTADDSLRLVLSAELQEVMVQTLKEANDFDYVFTTLNHVGNIVSSDLQVHLYSWNILLRDGTCLYYAIFQHRDEEGENKAIIPIASTLSYVPSQTETINADNWYGSIYYQIHPVEYRKEGTAYLIFGVMIPKGMPYRQKVADIIKFEDNGITFGDASIVYPGSNKFYTRLLFEYAANSNMALEFNPRRRTLYFDHLSPAYTTSDGTVLYGPDMSVDGFVFKRNKWKFLDDVRVRNKPEPKKK